MSPPEIPTVTRECPACETEFEGLNPNSDAWYCEDPECPVVMFGPRGLSDEAEDRADIKDILMQASAGGPRPSVQKAIRGDIMWSDLEYDDWVSAMSLDDRVCAKVAEWEDKTRYYGVTEERLESLTVAEDKRSYFQGSFAEYGLRRALFHGYTVRPVHRAETPLGGASP